MKPEARLIPAKYAIILHSDKDRLYVFLVGGNAKRKAIGS